MVDYDGTLLTDGEFPLTKRNSMTSPAKKAVVELSEQLAEDCSWDDAMYGLYVRQKIQRGLTDLEQGRIVGHKDVFREYADAIGPNSVDAISSE